MDDSSTIPTKTCTKCQQAKPSADFTRNRSTADGYFSYCRACAQAYERARTAAARAARPPKPLPPVPSTKACGCCGAALPLAAFSPKASGKFGRDSRCRSCKAALAADWVRRHPEELVRRNRQQYRAHHAQALERARRWRAAHPGYRTERGDAGALWWRETTARSRAKARGAVVEVVDFAAILARDGYRCHICGQAITPETIAAIEFDHVVPVERGGAHRAENIKVAHRFCNKSKGAKLVEELASRRP